MGGLVNFLAENIPVEKFNREDAQEAMFYIDFLLDNAKDRSETIKLIELKHKIVKHLIFLNNLKAD